MDEAMLANDKPSGHGGLENDWYSCSIRSKALCLLEPYVDEVGTCLLYTSDAADEMSEV